MIVILLYCFITFLMSCGIFYQDLKEQQYSLKDLNEKDFWWVMVLLFGSPLIIPFVIGIKLNEE